MIYEPIFKLLKKDVPIKLLKKDVPIKWDEQCQVAFNKIKEYLLKPPILVPPMQEKPLLLYLSTTDTTMGALLA